MNNILSDVCLAHTLLFVGDNKVPNHKNICKRDEIQVWEAIDIKISQKDLSWGFQLCMNIIYAQFP